MDGCSFPPHRSNASGFAAMSAFRASMEGPRNHSRYAKNQKRLCKERNVLSQRLGDPEQVHMCQAPPRLRRTWGGQILHYAFLAVSAIEREHSARAGLWRPPPRRRRQPAQRRRPSVPLVGNPCPTHGVMAGEAP